MLTGNNNDRIEIPSSKVKITLLLFLCILFVIGGISFITSPSTFSNSSLRHDPEIEIIIVGYACVLFFGTGVVVIIMKFFDNRPGLILDSEGIVINYRSKSAMVIKWGSIQKFDIINISGTKIIGIYLKDPERFIHELNGSFKQKMASFSLESYGTPVSISAGTLKYNATELLAILTERLNKTKGEGAKV